MPETVCLLVLLGVQATSAGHIDTSTRLIVECEKALELASCSSFVKGYGKSNVALKPFKAKLRCTALATVQISQAPATLPLDMPSARIIAHYLPSLKIHECLHELHGPCAEI